MERIAKVKDGGRLVVAQSSEGEPVPKEVLATAIVKISEGVEALRRSGLNERGVLALLSDKTGYGKGTLKMVLDALADLKKDYCR